MLPSQHDPSPKQLQLLFPKLHTSPQITALNSPLRQLFHYQDSKMLADVVRVASSISDKQSTIGHALTSHGPCVEKWILVATEVGRAS
jgi:hypothetical protein